jgi:hypothetical protein
MEHLIMHRSARERAAKEDRCLLASSGSDKGHEARRDWSSGSAGRFARPSRRGLLPLRSADRIGYWGAHSGQGTPFLTQIGLPSQL